MDEQKERALLARGVVPLESDQGLDAFDKIRSFDGAHLVVLSGNVSVTRPAKARRPRKAQASLSAADLADKLAVHLQNLLATTIKLDADRVNAQTPFEDYGIDSVVIMSLTQRLESDLGELPKTLFYEYKTPAELGNYLMESHRDAVAEMLAPEASEAAGTPEIPEPEPRNSCRRCAYTRPGAHVEPGTRAERHARGIAAGESGL